MQTPFRNVQAPKSHGPRVLKGYTLNGYEIILLENELLRVVVNLGRGAMIPEFLYKPADLDIMFHNPAGLRPHDTFTPSSYDEPAIRDLHPGGWYECFPSGSTPVVQNGAKIGFHGEVWGLPFELDSASESLRECSATMTAFTVRTPWRLTKTFALKQNDPTLYLKETATNLSNLDLAVMWGQHPFYGHPFIDEKCRLEIPGRSFIDCDEKPKRKRRWPTNRKGRDLTQVGKPGDKGKMVLITDLDEGKYRIVSPTWKIAAEMRWDAKKFPYCWLYEICRETQAPWWGRAYGLAFEPFTGQPKAIEKDEGVIRIKAQQSETVQFSLRIARL